MDGTTRAGRGPAARRITGAVAALVLVVGLAPAAVGAAGPPTGGSGPVPADDPVRGTEVLASDGDLLDRVATVNDLARTEAVDLLADPTTRVTADGHVLFADPAPTVASPSETAAGGIQALTTAVAPLAATFTLHSRPGADRTIFLDTDGHVTAGTSWAVDDGGPYAAQPYDTDGTPGHSATELQEIQDIWRRVAEDYAPFDVDVTTQDPGAARLRRDTAADAQHGTRVALTSSSAEPFGGVGLGGIAFYSAFDAVGEVHDRLQPAFAFTGTWSSPRSLAEVVSHEVGHNLDLRHDGTASAEYYSGHGIWSPIMGTASNHPVTQWSRGEYAGASNTEDDLTIMAGNGVGPLPDDHTDALATATALTGSASGLIATSTDRDLFRYVAPTSGSRTFTAAPNPVAPNLDVTLTLLSATGAQLAQANPTAAQPVPWQVVATGLDASLTHTVTAGATYYLRVQPTALLTPSTGYSTYGTLGPYTLRTSDQPACAALDAQEPNGSALDALGAPSGQPLSSRICPGDVDYVAIPAVAGQAIDVTLAPTPGQGDLDLTLVRPSGTTAATSAAPSGTETIRHVATETGLFLAEIAGKGAASATYTLTPTTATCPPDDGREPDGTPATAAPVPLGVQVSGIACPFDVDHLSVPVAAGQIVEVTVERPIAVAGLSLTVLDGTGAVVTSAGTSTGTGKLVAQARATATDVWRIRLTGGTAVSAYRVRTTRSGGPAVPAAPTGVTATGAAGQATVRWTAPSDGGSPITAYTVTPVVGGVAQPARPAPAAARSLAVPGLTNGVTASFRVAATNAVGTGPVAATPSVIPPFSSLATFVQRQSQDLRGVAATSAETTAAVAALGSGTTAGAHIAGLRTGRDATTHVDPTARLYFAYFRRVPDADGLAYWIGLKRGGRSLSQISSQFAASGEFRTVYGPRDDAGFVTLVYQNVLGRAPAPSEVAYWVGELGRGKTRGAVMIGFSESAEYRARMRASVDVAVTWIALLGARPATATSATWVADLTSGARTVADLAAAILADPAYAARVR